VVGARTAGACPGKSPHVPHRALAAGVPSKTRLLGHDVDEEIDGPRSRRHAAGKRRDRDASQDGHDRRVSRHRGRQPLRCPQAASETIRSIVPDAEECISYRIPRFVWAARSLPDSARGPTGARTSRSSGRTLRTLAKEIAGCDQHERPLHFDPEPVSRRLSSASF